MSPRRPESDAIKRLQALLPAVIILACMFARPDALKAEDSLEELSVSNGLSGISVRTVLGSDMPVPLVPAPNAVEVSIAGTAGTLKVYFVDVGQGDAEYIELPDGKTVLIDGGPAGRNGGPADPSHPAGDPPLAHFLLQKGVKKIDHVVLTHPHADHYVGLKYVFSRLPVGNFYDTRKDNPGTGDDAMRELAAKVPGINISYPSPGDYLDWGPQVQAKVFNSCPDPAAAAAISPNNCSIVIKLTYMNASVLFTGDLESGREPEVVARFGGELRADVLKVGHHGSAGASSKLFLDAVRPKIAYIEVGINNSYGHPRAETLARLQAAGARIYRTDLDGTQEYLMGSPPQFLASVYTQNPAQARP